MLFDFRIDVQEHIAALLGMKLAFETAQGHTNHVTVMQFRPGSPGAELQPQPMDQIDVFGPQPRRMRSQIEEQGILIWIRQNNLQR